MLLRKAGPLWVISGHWILHQPMSALPLKADMLSLAIDVPLSAKSGHFAVSPDARY
jgi:hypothetical protein